MSVLALSSCRLPPKSWRKRLEETTAETDLFSTMTHEGCLEHAHWEDTLLQFSQWLSSLQPPMQAPESGRALLSNTTVANLHQSQPDWLLVTIFSQRGCSISCSVYNGDTVSQARVL